MELAGSPLGGYVQIAGMVDEQMDKTIIDSEPKPWEFQQTGLATFAGNDGWNYCEFCLGIFIFWMVLWYYGEKTFPNTSLKEGVMVDSVAYNLGLRNGDHIIALDNKIVTALNRVPVEIVMNGVEHVQSMHSNGQKNLTLQLQIKIALLF